MSNWRVSETYFPRTRVAWGKRTSADTTYRVFADRDEAFKVYREMAAKLSERFKHIGRDATSPRVSIAATSERPGDWINPKGQKRAAAKKARAARRRAAAKKGA